MDRNEKKEVVAELHGKLKDAKLAVAGKLQWYERGESYRAEERGRNPERNSGLLNTLLVSHPRKPGIRAWRKHLKGRLAIALSFGDVVDRRKVLVDYAKRMLNWRLVWRCWKGNT